MSHEGLQYTHMTRGEAFEMLDRLACGIALVMGSSCETLVQEVIGKTFTVLSIYNGQISGRQVGSTLSIYGVDTTYDDGDQDFDPFLDINCEAVHTADGRLVKSSTWLIRGDGYVMAIGVNVDVTELTRAADLLAGMVKVGGELRDTLYHSTSQVSEDADALVDDCLQRLGKPVEALSKTDRVELVRLLEQRGFFEYQRSAAMLAARMGVSKSTIYNYLKELS
ncbi:Predicted transcriptional regulator YheO, contains PAS and DNA-binding HTH domains [Olsenella sp. KH3B4]|uniref:helix-turn-helix transcriptional regulator n=1 Tax=Olsenella sp. KH3B4 TaxID=1855394 RepID=UPI0008ACAF14|nr:helix-turn-helix domain-containing protein [Olsenella sp. KH3B4]SET00051.1 Predicted transcriptional regulator YheO, contains PAS and DNA-binding HTH domains [Olsenella sp. KH3B4]